MFLAIYRLVVAPVVITYDALISASEKGMQPDKALEVFMAMQQQGVVPHVFTYTSLCSAFAMGS